MNKKYFILVLLNSILLQGFSNNQTIEIKGTLAFLNDGDIVTLNLHKYGFNYKEEPITSVLSSRIFNHSFCFTFKLNDQYPQYFDLITSSKPNAKNIIGYLIEDGDSIDISDIDGKFKFAGNNSSKFNIQREIESIQNSYGKYFHSYFNLENLNKLFEMHDSATIQILNYVETQKSKLSKCVYDLLRVDCLASFEYQKYFDFRWFAGDGRVDTTLEKLKNVILKYQNRIFEKNAKTCFSNRKILPYSKQYTDFIISKYCLDSCYLKGKIFTIKNAYNYFLNNTSGFLRERILTTLLYDNRSDYSDDLASCLSNSIFIVKNFEFNKIIQRIRGARVKGAIAYDFALENEKGKIVRLSDFKNQVVLLDFWFTGCGACRILHPYLDSINQLFAGKNFSLISISSDINKNIWKKSIEEGYYTSMGGINLYTNGEGDKHPLIKNYLIEGYPTLIVIDKYGKLSRNPIDPRLDKGESLVKIIREHIDD